MPSTPGVIMNRTTNQPIFLMRIRLLNGEVQVSMMVLPSLPLFSHFRLTVMGCLTWQVTFGNGVRIGMILSTMQRVRIKIQQVLKLVKGVFYGVVLGIEHRIPCVLLNG